MARGFHIRLSIHDPEWLTPGHVLDVAREQGQWLSEIEMVDFIPAAVDAAKGLIAAIKYGPFFVNFDGIDSFGVNGETTQIVVSVDTAATNVPGPAPITEVTSSEVETPTENVEVPVEVPAENVEVPSVEDVNGQA